GGLRGRREEVGVGGGVVRLPEGGGNAVVAGAAAAGDLDPLLLGQCADPGRQSLVKRRVEGAAADAEVVGAAAGSEAAERLPVAGAGLDDTAATARERVIRVGPKDRKSVVEGDSDGPARAAD